MIGSFAGTVQKGDRRAAMLGYPTANIQLRDSNMAGVYVAEVRYGGRRYPAVAFADQPRKILEVHILDVKLELNGKRITIDLIEKVRDSRAFEDDGALAAAIADDVQKVREHFNLA